MNKSTLVRLFGHRATLVHGDTLVLDRWRWLTRRLPRTRNGERLLDVGCGTGAFTIGAALRGYDSLGLSWDERNQDVAAERARLSGAASARFEVFDVRRLDQRPDLRGQFDIAICFENAEHILDDLKLMRDIAACLRPGGRLYFTAPFHYYRAITESDNGPFLKTEEGWHVRRGYTRGMLLELCEVAGLVCEDISYCSGFVSQKITWMLRALTRIHLVLAWGVTLPLRVLPPVLDPLVSRLTGWPPYSICMEAYKPRLQGKTR
ncbi:MAG: class I SAM-dependent methyltransferase [Burkholderiales bacterium]|nr:class I SAM-dependent methyltransferase [Burkholderiales bacterium]